MSYKWKPSKTARREFAIKMQNPDEQAEYTARKEARRLKKIENSQFGYSSAGGNYIPTVYQNDKAFQLISKGNLTPEQFEACNMVISAYSLNDSCHHDYIHIVNELIRSEQNG